jgi:hypothetical protein
VALRLAGEKAGALANEDQTDGDELIFHIAIWFGMQIGVKSIIVAEVFLGL